MWVDRPTFMHIQGSVTLGRRATGTQGHKYVGIIGKLAHFIQRLPASDWIIAVELTL